MPPERPTFPIDGQNVRIQVTDDESRTLIHPTTDVAYHSASGAIAETRHVYLNNSGVNDRIASGTKTSVLEIGLGTGMAMLTTLDSALCTHASLDYVAIENEWLPAIVLRQLNLAAHLNNPSLATRFLQWRQSLGDPLANGVYRWKAGESQSVTIHHEDACDWAREGTGKFDAIYFDPFAPDANPKLWQPTFLSRMHAILSRDGRIVTYCVNRNVRDAFELVGFKVERVPGPLGGKREVMIATKRGDH